MQSKWYHYLLGFLAGVVLVNFLPHFISSMIGNRFPTPFASPPGRGLSSPVINLVWALFNLLIGALLFHFSRVTKQGKRVWIALVLGGVTMAFYLATYFERVLHR